MASIRKEGGFPHILDLPTVALGEGAYDELVYRRSWLCLVDFDSMLAEITITDGKSR